MRGLGTDHVISGPKRGQQKTASDGAHTQTTEGHTNLETESAQWANSVKTFIHINVQ